MALAGSIRILSHRALIPFSMDPDGIQTIVELGWAALPTIGVDADGLAVLEVGSMAEGQLAVTIAHGLANSKVGSNDRCEVEELHCLEGRC